MNNKIDSLSTLEDMFEYAKNNKYLKYIHKNSFSTITTKKMKNFLLSCEEEKALKTKIESLPYRYIIDPTNACNLQCPLCPTGLNASHRIKGIMKMDKFVKIIDQIKDHCIEVHLYNWGEPTLNKKLSEMLKYCTQNNIWTRISSNLSLKFKDGYLDELVKSGLSLLHVDLDGLDQDVYSKYRRKGDYNIVIGNIKELVKIKKRLKSSKPLIELSMLAMKQNEHQHEEFLNSKDSLGVDIVKIDKIQHNPNMDEKWLPENPELIYSTYEGGLASSRASDEKNIKPCHWPWSGMVINWDGTVNPCCIIDDPNSDFDNIENNSIKDIWNSEEYISSRSEFSDKTEITKETICNVCKNQTHSKRLNRVSKSFAIKL